MKRLPQKRADQRPIYEKFMSILYAMSDEDLVKAEEIRKRMSSDSKVCRARRLRIPLPEGE